MNKLSHILFNIAMLFPLLLYYFIVYNKYIEVLISIFLIISFSNYPDIDIKYKRGKLYKRIVYFIALIPFILYSLLIKKKGISHRGITHSITGTAIFSLFLALSYLLFKYFEVKICSVIQYNFCYLNLDLFFIIVFFSYFLHIIADSLTKEGVNLAGIRLRGFLITNKSDLPFVILFFIFQAILSFTFISNLVLLVVFTSAYEVSIIAFVYLLEKIF